MYICAISCSKRHIENRYYDECVYVGEDLELVLGRDMATLWHTITDCSTSDESRARSLTAWVWVCCIVTQERERDNHSKEFAISAYKGLSRPLTSPREEGSTKGEACSEQ